MDSNTHSTGGPDGPDGLGAVVAELQGLAAQAVGGLPDGGWAERLLVLRGWWSAGKARGSPTSPP
jgi:hypothetical protein